jgi:type IV pilus assembly protein PilX
MIYTSLNVQSVPRSARGAVLFVALVFLVLLTMLAVTATGSSILQEKMTGGMRNRQLGFMGAETAVRGGEAHLWSLSFEASQPLPPCVNNAEVMCVHRPQKNGLLSPMAQEFRTSKEWIESGVGVATYINSLTELSDGAETANLSEQPRYLIENLGPDVPPSEGQTGGAVFQETTTLAGKHEFYRVTGRSLGGTAAVVRAAESVYTAIDLTNTGFNPEAAPAPTP